MSQAYQSRVFTFFGTRTNQLKNTCAEGLRKLKVVVIWSGQILLYPLLVAQQKIFQPKIVPPPSPSIFAQPVPDINIEAALDLVEVAGYPIQVAGKLSSVDDWSFIDENLWNTGHGNAKIKGQDIADRPRLDGQGTPPQPIIRGLSSVLANRQLVLVGTKNELVDILPISYQQELRRRIGLDLAIAWHEWHTAQLPEDRIDYVEDNRWPFADRFNRNRDLPSPALFDRVRNWFQNSHSNYTPTHEDRSVVESDTYESNPPQRLLAPSAHPVTLRQPNFSRYFDLPQLPPIIEQNSSTSGDRQTSIVANIAHRLQPDWLKTWWNYYREYLYIPSDNDAIVPQPTEFKLIPIEPTPSKIKSHRSIEQPQIQQTTRIKIDAKFIESLEYGQDWIDTEAETIGYSRSLLTRILSWIDRLIFAIENWLINLFASI